MTGHPQEARPDEINVALIKALRFALPYARKWLQLQPSAYPAAFGELLGAEMLAGSGEIVAPAGLIAHTPPDPMAQLGLELKMVAAMGEALAEHFPDHDEHGGIVCRCGARFPRISATAWHRHAAAMCATALSKFPEPGMR